MWFSFVSFHQITSENTSEGATEDVICADLITLPAVSLGRESRPANIWGLGEWNVLCTEALNGIALMIQHLIVKQHWSKGVCNLKRSNQRNNISKKSCLHVATAESKVSQLQTGAFYWTAAMNNTCAKKARIEKKYTIKAAFMCMEQVWMQWSGSCRMQIVQEAWTWMLGKYVMFSFHFTSFQGLCLENRPWSFVRNMLLVVKLRGLI